MRARPALTQRLRALSLGVKLFATALLLGGAAMAAEKPCDKIVVAEFDWDGAKLAAHLLQRLLVDGLGCAATRAPASPEGAEAAFAAGDAWLTAPGMAAPRAGDPAPTWRHGAPLFSGAERAGFYAPEWTLALDPPIRRIGELRDHAERFAEAPGARPKLHLCPEAWACGAASLRAAQLYGLDAAFDLVTPPSGDALLGSIEAAARQSRPWLGYAWEPSTVVAQYRLRFLDIEPVCDGSGCAPVFDEPTTVVAYAVALEQTAPSAAAVIRSFQAPGDAVADALAWRQAEAADFAEAADYLLAANTGLWRDLLDARAAATFESALRARLLFGPR